MQHLRSDIELSIIIVSYNTRDVIGVCLDSIAQVDQDKTEIFVVDNASTDGSADFLGQYGAQIHLIANRENKGFAAANNQAIPLCRGRFILFLNPDIEYLPATFGHIISFLDKNPHIGLAGLKTVNPNGSFQESYSRTYPGEQYVTDELSDLKGGLAWVLGASMITRREVIGKVGGFDERFFVYGEEQDLCLRIRRAGYEIGYLDFALVVHLGGQSERTTMVSDVWRKKILAEYLFYYKHYSPQTIKKIVRTQSIQAFFRIMTLKVLLPFIRDQRKKVVKEKLMKYETTYDSIRCFLKEKALSGKASVI